MKNIRNFCIVAHIDHGKSTLADRILEHTNTIPRMQMKDQILDEMDIERERGITIRSKTVRIDYTHEDGSKYVFNLVDTPGHVDFSYEISRVMTSCEGALLLVDASQGVEAQTLANTITAKNAGLKIIPIINKIDLQTADIEEAKRQGKDPGQVGYPHIKPHHVYYIAKKYRDEYGLEPRRKHKKPEEPETKTFYGVPREADMPHEVVQYLMRKGWLLE